MNLAGAGGSGNIKVHVATKLFFEPQKIAKSADDTMQRYFLRVGAFTRRRARSIIRKRKKPSQPGQPPSSHVGTLKNFLFFAKHPDHRVGVIVGPAKTNQITRDSGGARANIPDVLEHGGTIVIVERALKRTENWHRMDMRRATRPWEKTRSRTVTIQPRPYMAPAFAEALGKLGGAAAGLASS
jgi:hypothetical protein